MGAQCHFRVSEKLSHALLCTNMRSSAFSKVAQGVFRTSSRLSSCGLRNTKGFSSCPAVTAHGRLWAPEKQHLCGTSTLIDNRILRRLRSDSASTSTEAGATGQTVYDGMPKLLVFGGNGFVGTRVCEEAVSTGLQIVSINRSGRPKQNAAWVDQVDWLQADVFDVAQWRSQLEGAVGVVSCIGAFGSNDFMYKICGESNATIFREAAAAGVARAAFISVMDYKLPDWVLSGYFRGKRYAEQVLREKFPEGGVALRPGFMHGTRMVGGVGVPLGAVGWPLEKALAYVPTKELAKYPLLALGFVPPVNVKAVAKAAVAAATDSSIPPGALDVWELQKFESSL